MYNINRDKKKQEDREMSKWLPNRFGELKGYGGFHVSYADVSKSLGLEDSEGMFLDIIGKVMGDMKKRYDTMEDVLEWDGEGLVLLENAQVQVVMGMGEDNLGVFVIIPADMYNPVLAQRNLIHYVNRLEKILVEMFGEGVVKFEG